MKKIYSLVSFLLCFGLSSCKDFLDKEPSDFMAPDTYFKTEQEINFARASVYNNLGGSLWGGAGSYLLGFTADEGYMNRANLPVGSWNYNFNPSDGTILAFWSNLYSGINRANVLLANLDNNTSIKQEFRDRVRGEMLFLRGYYYFLLVQNFGGIPLKITPTSSVIDVDQPKASIKEVYDQIIKDMEAAEPLVLGIRDIGHAGQISKSAVRGLLARVNLYMAGYPLQDVSRYAEARKWAKMVMDDTQAAHDLNPSYAQVFINMAADQYDITESIWEVEFWGNRQDQYVETGNIGWNNGPAIPSTSPTGRADAYVNAAAPIFDVYEAGDMRKFWNIAYFSYTATSVIGSKSLLNEPTAAQKYTGRYPGKFRREYEKLFPKSATNTPINFPLLRYSDILLMFAEADNEINGPTQEAIDAVNKVRRRSFAIGGIKALTITARGSGYTSNPTVKITGVDIAGNKMEVSAVPTRGAIASNLNQIVALTLVRDSSGINFYKMGKFYISETTPIPPTVTITGGGGTGAQATATIFTEDDAKGPATLTNTQANFRKLIQDERMRELAFECLRKPDLIRWGIFLETMQNVANSWKVATTDGRVITYSNVEPKHLLFPIPANEMNTNLKMEQNLGW